MNFNTHSELEGRHAFLSASKSSWIRYDDDKLIRTYQNHRQAALGSEQHDLAAKLISMGIKLPASKKTLNMYVNDAIGFRMTPEQPLIYSRNAFGTADAISFRKGKGGRYILRIHDLKTGVSPVSFDQLMVYVAFFCFEYKIKPSEIDIELRLYKEDEVQTYEPELDEIVHIMDKIVTFDRIIESMRAEEA